MKQNLPVLWTPEAADVLVDGCRALGIRLDDHQRDSFRKLAELLIDANRRMNLTTITEPCAIASKHFVDSLTIVRVAELHPSHHLVDLGTGAGFPGLPLAIVSGARVTFIDATKKKLNFVEATCQALALDRASFLWARSEDVVTRHPALNADLVVVRGLGHLSTICELAAPLVKVGGRIVAYKGPQAEQELEPATRAARTLRLDIDRVERFSLPNTNDGRMLIGFVKRGITPRGFPRSGNLPKRSPLGV